MTSISITHTPAVLATTTPIGYLFYTLSGVTLNFTGNTGISATLGAIQNADTSSVIYFYGNTITHNVQLTTLAYLFGTIVSSTLNAYNLVVTGTLGGILSATGSTVNFYSVTINH